MEKTTDLEKVERLGKELEKIGDELANISDVMRLMWVTENVLLALKEYNKFEAEHYNRKFRAVDDNIIQHHFNTIDKLASVLSNAVYTDESPLYELLEALKMNTKSYKGA